MRSIRATLVAALVIFAATVSAQNAKPAPNILILLVDDLGWNDVGFHAPAAPTPNIHRLAKEGLELQRFYSYPVRDQPMASDSIRETRHTRAIPHRVE